MRHFPNFIDSFMEYTAKVEAPERYLRWSALSVLSGALERRVWQVFNDLEYVYPNMYIVLVGASGLAKKSSSSSKAIDLLRYCKNIRFMSNQVSEAGLVDQMHLAGVNRYIHFGEAKFHNSSLFLYSSEASETFSKRMGSDIAVTLTNFYDCNSGPWSNSNAWTKNLKSSGETKIYNPCLGMLACSTPEWLKKSIGASEIKGGFASRMLFVVHHGKPRRSVGMLDRDQLPEGLPIMRAKLIADLQHISTLQGRFEYDPTYKPVFNKLKRANDKFMEFNPRDKFMGYYARKLWHCMKVAQVIAISTSDQLILTGSHLKQAHKLVSSLESDMRDAFGFSGDNYFAEGLNNLWSYFRTKERFTMQQILVAFYEDIPSKVIHQHLETLIEWRKIVRERDPQGQVSYKVINGDPLTRKQANEKR